MNSRTARERILARLHSSGTEQTEVPEAPPVPALFLSPEREEKIQRLVELMTAIRTEVHIVEADAWQKKLKELAREKRWEQILYGPEGPLGPEIETAWSSDADQLPNLVAYTKPIETFKEKLFSTIDVGITSTVGGVADTGAVVLWPSPKEPRLMSLVPPVHVAVLDADIEFTLVFGVHGPKELVVIIRK